jgi:Tfp pilus assembly protein PilO
MTDTPQKTPATKGASTPLDRLMEASGVKTKVQPRQEFLELGRRMDQSFQAVVAETGQALQSAKETQQQTEHMFNQLKNFCSTTMPKEMENALEKMAQRGFDESLQPLRDKIRETAQDMETCRWKLCDSIWELRLFAGSALTGVLLALVAFGVMYHFFFSESYDEMKRYAQWGRKVEAEFQRMPAKQRAQVFAYYGRP